MSELEALLIIHGAIDRAAVDHPELADVVGRYYRPYAGGGAIGWFDEFRAWTAELTDGDPSETLIVDPTEVAAAIDELAETPPSILMLGHRMLAIAVAGRVLPDADFVADAADLAPALAIPDAVGLFELLRDDEIFGDAGMWPDLVQTAFVRGFLGDAFVEQSPSAPCSGKLVTVTTPGSSVVAAALETRYTITTLTFEQAKKVLEPERWRGCNPLWCEMTRTGTSPAGNDVYHEVVSLDCLHKPRTWTAACDLEFRRFDTPEVSIVSYNLLRPAQPGDAIQVDSGSLEVRQVGAEIHVHTTKRIRFGYPFTGEALAMVACALGYGAVAKALVFCCASSDSQAPPAPKRPKRGKKARPNDAGDALPYAIAATRQCAEECIDAYQSSYQRAAQGGYSTENLVQDAMAMWTRMMRDAVTAVDVGASLTRAMAGRYRPTPAPDPDPAPVPEPAEPPVAREE